MEQATNGIVNNKMLAHRPALLLLLLRLPSIDTGNNGSFFVLLCCFTIFCEEECLWSSSAKTDKR
jgi:hypothetical protein